MSDDNPSPSQTALDKFLQNHTDSRCLTGGACMCGRDEALAEVEAMRKQLQAVRRGVIQAYKALDMDVEIFAALYAPQAENKET